jgi:hypothetical protein
MDNNMLEVSFSHLWDAVNDSKKLYSLQKQIILKLLSVIELVLDNNWEGEIKLNKAHRKFLGLEDN